MESPHPGTRDDRAQCTRNEQSSALLESTEESCVNETDWMVSMSRQSWPVRPPGRRRWTDALKLNEERTALSRAERGASSGRAARRLAPGATRAEVASRGSAPRAVESDQLFHDRDLASSISPGRQGVVSRWLCLVYAAGAFWVWRPATASRLRADIFGFKQRSCQMPAPADRYVTLQKEETWRQLWPRIVDLKLKRHGRHARDQRPKARRTGRSTRAHAARFFRPHRR